MPKARGPYHLVNPFDVQRMFQGGVYSAEYIARRMSVPVPKVLNALKALTKNALALPMTPPKKISEKHIPMVWYIHTVELKR